MSTPKLKCIYGNTVTLKNLSTQASAHYKLVTYTEERLDENAISNYTEIGKAIWAKEEGFETEILLLDGTQHHYRVEKIINTPKN